MAQHGRDTFPRELFSTLEQYGAVLEEKYKGIYYETLKEVPIVCEALRDLMKNEIREELSNAEISSAIKTYDEVGVGEGEIISKIADRFSLSKETATSFVKSTLNLQAV